MNHKTTALGKKLGKVKDFLTGTSRVDNAKNPGSAYSMMKRKQKNTTPAALQNRTKVGPEKMYRPQ